MTPGQVYLHLNYQTPLRIQMGNTGRRLQLTVGVVRLSDQIELAGETYKGTGTGFDVAVSLVPRKGYYFHGPESKTLNKSGFIQLGYRSGEIDEYRGGSPEAVLAFEDGGALNYKPRGWWLGIDWDFFGF